MRDLTRAIVLSGVILATAVAPASAAQTIGQTFLPDPADGNPCGGDYTYLQSTSPGGLYAAPSAGVITAWSFHANASPPTLKLKVARSTGTDSFQIVGTSQAKSPTANQLNTYTDVRISVLANDVIGFSLLSTGDCARGQPTGYDYHFASGDLAPGPAVPFTASGFFTNFDIAAMFFSNPTRTATASVMKARTTARTIPPPSACPVAAAQTPTPRRP